MKPLQIALTATITIGCAAVWYSRQVSEAASLRSELASLRAESTRRSGLADKANAPQSSNEEAALLEQQIADLRKALAREDAAAKAAEKSIEEIRRKLPPLDDGDTIVSLGRITDMGKEAAQALRGVFGQLRGSKLPPAEIEQSQASFVKLIAWGPEISGFEERPAEMASFQGALLQELFHLDESRARQVESILKTHFDALHSARLTAAYSAEPTWKERRTAALTPLLWQLRPFMPRDFDSPEMLGMIVNVGAGFETKTETRFSKEPGKSSHSVSMSLPSWPRLPWLPPKESVSK